MDKTNKKIVPLMVAALGVVYGDIGTSPLYALKSCFTLSALPVTENNVLGLISIFLWLLIIIVNFKYISLVLKCDHEGEGGVLVLSSLLSKVKECRVKKIIFTLGIAAMALFVGDSVITPAISVMSALEGLNLIINITENNIIFGAILILVLLFYFQSKGSEYLGRYFGIIMFVWFAIIGLLGLVQIIKNPIILIAINPYYAISFLARNGIIAWASLGGAILVITGVEALYADMGHFGREAISKAWMCIVLPSLALNYLGQGSLLMLDPASIINPFYLLAPKFFIYPLTFISILATIIASQAVISGLFSLSWQAIMLHYVPRLRVVHTSNNNRGQIYIPAINLILCVLCITAVLIFRNSNSLAAAYGLSVASVMLISTIFVIMISYYIWKWNLAKIVYCLVPILCFDILFVTTSIEKLFEGAWYTVVIGMAVAYIINTWFRGNEALKNFKTKGRRDLKTYIAHYLEKNKTRIPGCAVFMSRLSNYAPLALEVQLQHNKFLHEKLLFISVIIEDAPIYKEKDKYVYEELLPGIFKINSKFGFIEKPNLEQITSWAEKNNIIQHKEDLSYFLGRSLPIQAKNGKLKGFSEKLYIFLTKNALPSYEFFNINFHKVIELGVRFKV